MSADRPIVKVESGTLQAAIDALPPLKLGSHSSNQDMEMCAMEAAAYVAGEPWSDHPACVCPVVTAFMISWNDSLPSDEERDRLLKPLIPLILGTRSTAAVEAKRAYLALDWLVRVFTPKWLDMVPALHGHAIALRELDEISDLADAVAAGTYASAAGAAAWDAARDAARAAFKPTTAWLQVSAVELVHRMIAIDGGES